MANVTFRDLNKTAILSNDLRVNLDLASEGALTTAEDDTEIGDGATLGEPEQSQASNPLRNQIKKNVELIPQYQAERMKMKGKVKENKQYQCSVIRLICVPKYQNWVEYSNLKTVDVKCDKTGVRFPGR